jgi:hypothetical protein
MIASLASATPARAAACASCMCAAALPPEMSRLVARRKPKPIMTMIDDSPRQ